MIYKVALCGLTVRDQRLSEIVMARAPNPRYRYRVGSVADLGDAHIAVVDVASGHAESQLVELRAMNPALEVVYLSDLGLSGDSRYRIERRSLLLRIARMLDEVVERELLRPHAVTAPARTADAAVCSESAFLEEFGAFEQPPPQPLRALIVDDSPAAREQLRSALDRSGILSDQAGSAESALNEIRANSYDLVLLHVVMPEIDGYEICRNIKKNAYTRNLPVVMLTNRSSPFDRARGALAGCDSYLVKPITWESFFTAIDRVLTKHFRNDRALLSARGYRAAVPA